MKIARLDKCLYVLIALCLTLTGCSDDNAFYFSLNTAEHSMEVDDSYQFTAKAQNTDHDIQSAVTWSLIDQKNASGNDASIATIDQNGKVTAVSEGTAKVKAEISGGHYALAYITISKRHAPTNGMAFAKSEVYSSIDNVVPDTLELLVDTNISKHFKINVKSDSTQFVNPTVIRKDAGTYQVVLNLGGKEGTATLTASASSYEVKAKVHVGAKLYLSFENINVSLGAPTLNTLSSFTFNVGTETVIPIHFLCVPDDAAHLNNLDFYVSTSGSNLFKSISQHVEGNILYLNVLVGKEKGDANIIIEALGNKITAECNVMDKNDVEVTSCKFASTEITTDLKNLSLYESVKIKPIAAAALWPAVWTSSDETVATVNASGVVSFKKHGVVEIKATAKDKSDVCKITAQLRVSKIEFGTSASKMTVGESSEWTVSATTNYDDQSGLKKVWTSSDASVASVDANGKVVALKAGTTTITVTATDDLGNSVTTSQTLTVNDASAVKIYDLNFGENTFNYELNGNFVDVFNPNGAEDKYYSFNLLDASGSKLTLNAGTYQVGTQISTSSYIVFNEFNGERATLESGTLTVDASGKLTFDLHAKEGNKTVSIVGKVTK